jgi:hypothetical protein
VVALLNGDDDQLADVEAEARTRRRSITIVFDLIQVIHHL